MATKENLDGMMFMKKSLIKQKSGPKITGM